MEDKSLMENDFELLKLQKHYLIEIYKVLETDDEIEYFFQSKNGTPFSDQEKNEFYSIKKEEEQNAFFKK